MELNSFYAALEGVDAFETQNIIHKGSCACFIESAQAILI